jgi:hypothetical protein
MLENHFHACRPTPKLSFLKTMRNVHDAVLLCWGRGILRLERGSIINCQGHKNPPNAKIRINQKGRNMRRD